MGLYMKTYLGRQLIANNGNIAISGKDKEIYSESETIIGYFNNYPLYRKIICFDSINKDNEYTIYIDNLNKLINYYGYCSINGTMRPLPFIQDNTTNKSAIDSFENGNCKFKTGYDLSNAVIVFEYTKTTDTPVSNTYSYSMEEKLTGETWVDGKPIYRKVIEVAINHTSSKIYRLDVSDLNIDKTIKLHGINITNGDTIPCIIIENSLPWSVSVSYDGGEKQIIISWGSSVVSRQATYNIIIEYTKASN